MSNPLQPLSPDRLYKFAERMGSVERAVSSVIADSDRDKRRREETDSRKIHKFARYRLARAKKVDGNGGKTYEDVYDYITKEELDYYLKKALEEPPEARYQRKKDNTFFHDSYFGRRGLERYDGIGCNQFTGCVPSCRYYPDVGRIEDDEIIKKYDDEIAERRKSGTLIE